ncbi:insulinase family protein [Cellulophaga sp. 20_2_10]|uniref:M16 family metallopeptidase n=1 Tax=Cellulophaga sp. 20_2_10 TaxID=2942476 RepID=UPI00201A2C58|nr:M16 family metallopeptidase [Cellulophaga sp. 20_2_10]MCL5244833.1 insulinase family protein [Cellulophaga sp. 20_2_10]
MKKITTLLSLFLCIGLSAQQLDLNQPLPVNTKFKKGVLPNGMTYYIYNTDVTKGVASYYIIQNVGSILENDDQQGLAHFLEHMAFNGTKNFAGKGILNTLQKHGAVFGKDINAYTGFDETVYNMDNIPTKDGLVDTCLLVLNDWSNYLLLTDEEIDAERGVIKEEWRTRQNGGMRILQQSLPVMFNNSKYSNRLPIGLMDVVDNFEYKALRDFYHDWYRTDLQAIAIVGDINVDEIEQKIKDKFSKIPAVKNPKERFSVEIPGNKEMLYNIAMDEEVSTASISFSINHPKKIKDQTIGDLKESLLKGMATSMLSTRLNEIRQQPDATFLGARVGFREKARLNNDFSVNLTPKPGQQQEAFKTVMDEINRAVKFGFTDGEIDRIKKQYESYYENSISKEDDMSHGQLINSIKSNYLSNETITPIAEEYKIVQAIFASVTKEDFHTIIKNLYTTENRTLNVTGVKGKNNLTKEEGLAIISASENNSELTAYADEFSGKTLISGTTIKAGSIVSEEENKETGATIFTLSNGAKVYYKFADKNKNDVKLTATSYGGTSLLEDKDLPSANIMSSIVQMSGLGDFSATELPKVLAGKTANTSVNLSSLSESISGSSTTKDVETMLQMVYLRFENPRFDEDAYKVLQGNITNFLARKSKDINSKMQDSVTVTLYGDNNPKERLMDEAYMQDVSFNKMKEIYLERFKNAADFTFFVVGDIQKDALKPLLAKYIASISANATKENYKVNPSAWINNSIDKDIFLKMEDEKGSVRVGYKNEMKYSLKNDILASALGDILQLRITETVREAEGGAYSPRAGAGFSKRPVSEGSISVSFDCNPDKVDDLLKIVHTEIKKIGEGEISQVDLDKTLTNFIKERKESKDYNGYDMSLLQNYVLEGYNMNDPKNFENIVNSITVKDIQKFTKKLLKGAKTYEIAFKPKQ